MISEERLKIVGEKLENNQYLTDAELISYETFLHQELKKKKDFLIKQEEELTKKKEQYYELLDKLKRLKEANNEDNK